MNTSDMKQAIAQRIESLREDAAELLMDLVRYPSVCGDEMGAVNHMRERMVRDGFSPKIITMDESIKSHPEYTHYTVEPSWEGRGNLVTDYGGAKGGRSRVPPDHAAVLADARAAEARFAALLRGVVARW